MRIWDSILQFWVINSKTVQGGKKFYGDRHIFGINTIVQKRILCAVASGHGGYLSFTERRVRFAPGKLLEIRFVYVYINISEIKSLKNKIRN